MTEDKTQIIIAACIEPQIPLVLHVRLIHAYEHETGFQNILAEQYLVDENNLKSIMLDFSYYDLLMAIGVTFPLITGGVDLSIGTGMVCYALIGGTLIRSHGIPVIVAMLVCVLLGVLIGTLNGVLIGVMNLPPFLATLCTCMITRGAGSLCTATPWPGLTQEGGWFHSIFKLTIGTGRSADRYYPSRSARAKFPPMPRQTKSQLYVGMEEHEITEQTVIKLGTDILTALENTFLKYR